MSHAHTSTPVQVSAIPASVLYIIYKDTCILYINIRSIACAPLLRPAEILSSPPKMEQAERLHPATNPSSRYGQQPPVCGPAHLARTPLQQPLEAPPSPLRNRLYFRFKASTCPICSSISLSPPPSPSPSISDSHFTLSSFLAGNAPMTLESVGKRVEKSRIEGRIEVALLRACR